MDPIAIIGYLSLAVGSALAGNGVAFDIFEGAAKVGSLFWANTANGYHMSAHVEAVLEPTAGTHTYSVKISHTAAGTLDTGAGTNDPQFILVELI